MSEEQKTEKTKQKLQLTQEEKDNLFGFFDLAFRIAIREGIDIGQFDDNEENYD